MAKKDPEVDLQTDLSTPAYKPFVADVSVFRKDERFIIDLLHRTCFSRKERVLLGGRLVVLDSK